MTEFVTSDILWGAEAIAAAIQRDRSSTFHLLNAGALPAKKVGGRWCASRRKLREFLTGEAA
jgi:hypothetical protein